ncbi:hypothetical protein [Aegicerativicinus sediminis]
MKNLVFILCLFFGLQTQAQDVHFTVYNFSVESQDVSTIFKLFDDYFSKHKPANVNVGLYENHFNDSSNNFTHSVVFSGSLDALGGMYAGGDNDTWSLFITRVNQHMKDGFSSAMGTRLAIYGNANEPHPFQRYYLLDVDNMSKWVESYENAIGKHNPAGRLNMMGRITVGHGPDGVNAWVINGFKDFKAAMAGANALRTDAENEASSKAWAEHRENGGDVKLVRSGLRILLKSW